MSFSVTPEGWGLVAVINGHYVDWFCSLRLVLRNNNGHVGKIESRVIKPVKSIS